MNREPCLLSWPAKNIAKITLNRPDKLNAIDVVTLKHWQGILKALVQNRPVCVLLTGAGRAFSAGADLRATVKVAREHNGQLDQVLQTYYYPVMHGLRQLECPIISVVNGPAVGIGFAFALYGDIILAGQHAYFWANFSRIGLVPDGGMTYLLPRRVGYQKSMDWILTAKKVSAQEAQQAGLVAAVYAEDQLEEEALKLAQQMSAQGALCLHATKKLLMNSAHHNFTEQIDAESQSQALAGQSPEALRAWANFIDRNKQDN